VPELPEVEQMLRLVRAIAPGAGECQLVVYDSRLGATGGSLGSFQCAQRRGKELALSFSGSNIYIHPRMTGRLSPIPTTSKARAVFEFENGEGFAFIDRRCLGALQSVELSNRDLGPEPWEEGAAARDGSWYRRAFGAFSGGVKAALMNQRLIAGLGNIAATESLWRAGVDPTTPVQRLTDSQMESIAEGVHKYIESTLAAEDPFTMRYVNEGGDNPFMIYGREGQPCPKCSEELKSVRLGGRGTVWCPGCQN